MKPLWYVDADTLGLAHVLIRALARALRTEPVAEVVRTIGMILNGDSPCT